MIWFLYYLLIYLMNAGIRISVLWSKKSKAFIAGRKAWHSKLQHALPQKKPIRIWFHVSSLGEFEQSRPVIEKLKEHQPGTEIILTFFSPSGYSIRSDYALATVFYLPVDLPGNAKKWLSVVRPDFAVFVKYDLWPGYLKVLDNMEIPTILISAHWTRGNIFSSWSLPPTRSLLKKFKKVFLQKGDNTEYFRNMGFKNIEVVGDTRIDRSLNLPDEALHRIPDYLKMAGPFDLIAGSTWPPDEKILVKAISRLGLKVLLAPHDVSEENIQRLIHTFPFPVQRLSKMRGPENNHDVIIVDHIGLLSVLYSLGKIAYVGGGFGSGIHNTLEPMAHGRPLIFGPAYKKFPEAVDMVQSESAKSVRNSEELIKVIQHLSQPGVAEIAGRNAYDYLKNNAGASRIIANYILESIPYSVVR